ncbi:MAG TPA: flagellar hook-associated protein FlgK [Tepidisphaeraceae bacterium]|nr:flagellar hook-associated protein FlgK [Tepidisphaeraceae bacterium]
MSLTRTLNIGKSALATHQAAIQATGNNIANAGNADYTRQTAQTAPSRDHQIRPGVFVGTGVNLTGIQRHIDEALEGRIRGSISDNEGAATTEQWISRVESTLNELSEDDLSTQLSTFFNSWSNLANKPQDVGYRQVVVQNGEMVASSLKDLRGQLSSLRADVDGRLTAQVDDADRLAKQIAHLNREIVLSEGGSAGQANGLRDQRDAAMKQLSQLIDVRAVEQKNGTLNVYVGSDPLVINGDSRGLTIRNETIDGVVTPVVAYKHDNGNVRLTSGQIGALTAVRQRIGGYVDKVDEISGNIIFELNKIHSAGQGIEGFAAVSATNVVTDSTVALNDDRSGVPFKATNGSFVVHVKDKTTGLVTSTLIEVDLDGLNADDTTLDDLVARMDNIGGLSAINASGLLKLSADSTGVELSFSQDSSGVLAALGVNSFYSGRDATDIALSPAIKGNPNLLAAAKNGEKGDNQTALAIAALESAKLPSLGGASLKERYQSFVNEIAIAAADAKTDAEASAVVKETLLAQREALSGVSLDEEAINLIRQQRAFQGASRLIAAVDELMQQILALV